MKRQHFNKKLSLNKRTITDLGNSALNALFAGGEPSGGCPSIDLKCEITYTCWSVCYTCDHTCGCL